VSEFAGIESESDPSVFSQQIKEQLEGHFSGIEFAEGDPLNWLVEARGRLDSMLAEQASSLSAAAFKGFGEKVASVPPIQAAPATVTSTWTMIDEAGYTIPAGTQVAISAAGDQAVGFIVVGEVTVAPDDSETAAGAVLLQAIEAGEAANELSGEAELVDSLAFVQGVVLDGVTSGGVDEEEEDAYLNRLVDEMQLRSTALILPRDFEIDGRSYAGVARVKCVRNYNPEDESTKNPLMQCIFPITAQGEPVSSPRKEELLAGQQAKLITDVIHHVADPTYTTVDVKTGIVVQAGADPEATVAAVEARLLEYLNPANWGLPGFGDPSSIASWVNRLVVYRFELISETDRVGGVDRVESLELAKHGSALGTANVSLTGVAPLTKPGTITVTAV
jgi:hypothetical protein